MRTTSSFESLRGKRYIAYARCCSKQGSSQSLRRQIRLIRQFANSAKMKRVDELQFPGVNGVTPPLRWDLNSLLARKCNQDDYDVLILEDPSRLTRGSLTGMARLETLFALCGVQIVYVSSWQPNGTAPSGHKSKQIEFRAGAAPVQRQMVGSQ